MSGSGSRNILSRGRWRSVFEKNGGSLPWPHPSPRPLAEGPQGFWLDCVICAAFLRVAMDTRRRCEAWDGCPPRCLRVPSLLTLCSDTCASPGTSLIPPQRCLHGASGGTQAASQCPAPPPSVWHGPQNLGSGVDADCLLSPGGTGRVFPLGRSGYCQPGPRGIVLLFWQQNLRNCEERPSGSTLYCLRF